MHNEDAGHISLGDGGGDGGSGGGVFVFSVITIPDHGRRRNAQFSPQFHSESTKFPKLFFFFFCSLMSDRQLCSFKWEGDRERERIFALDSFLEGVFGVSIMVCFRKDWICNKIEHRDVGMVFHSTLESGCHLEKTNILSLLLCKVTDCAQN